jgi:hypothetical protein
MSETVLYNQSILDIAIQHTGMVQNCFDIAITNGFSVSDILSQGFSLDIPETLQKETAIYNYYEAKGIKPATAKTDEGNNEVPTLKGIGYMRIGGDFKVS